MSGLPALPTPPAAKADWTSYDQARLAWEKAVDAFIRPQLAGSSPISVPAAPSQTLAYDAVAARGIANQAKPIAWAASNGVKLIFTEVGIPATIDTNDNYDSRWDTVLKAWFISARKQGIPWTVWGAAEWNIGLRAYASAAPSTSGTLALATNVAADLEPYLSYSPLNGVNLSGGDFGQNGQTLPTVPGVLNTDYYYPSNADFNYLASRGITNVRVPFRWERLQHAIGSALDATEITRFKAVLDAAANNGITVIADLHNYGGYTVASGQSALLLGQNAPSNSAGITTMNAALADFWTRFAGSFGSHAGLGGYGLMNEPHDLTGGGDTWRAASRLAANALFAATGTSKLIYVSGYFYGTASDWVNQNGSSAWLTDVPSGQTLALNKQPNVYFESHMYFDDPNGGVYTNQYVDNLNAATSAGFTSGSITG